MSRASTAGLVVATIGHSNRSLEDFIALLREHRIDEVVDVRTVPKSRHNPQFGGEALAASLHAEGLGYRYMAGLGGLRHSPKDSINRGWRNSSFRGYADYMQSEEFAQNIDVLMDVARAQRVTVMCAEAVPWRCHRSLIGDALLVRGVAVEDIIGPGLARPHRLTAFAHVEGLRITYPAEGALLTTRGDPAALDDDSEQA